MSTYDFICLCCGARNGARIPTCSFNKYVTADGDLNSKEFAEQLASWVESRDYKGSLLVPEDYPMDEDYRLSIIQMTDAYRRSRKGIILFGMPGVKLPEHAVSLAQFLN